MTSPSLLILDNLLSMQLSSTSEKENDEGENKSLKDKNNIANAGNLNFLMLQLLIKNLEDERESFGSFSP